MELKRIVNIMPDDKFLDYYIQMSENFIPEASSYVVLSNEAELKYIKSEAVPLIVLQKRSESYDCLLQSLHDRHVIVFHSFRRQQYPFIQALQGKHTTVWIFWGWDGYGALAKASFQRFGSHFAQYPKNAKGLLRSVYHWVKNNRVSPQNKINQEIIRAMDYCATWVDADFAMARAFNPELRQLYFTYYSRELMGFDQLPVQKADKNKLFLGNSGDVTNNHMEALRYLHAQAYPGEIICSLSYGGWGTYVDTVCRLGKRLFGARFIAIRDFMPLSDYQALINSCGIVWMNHKRQQAAGNLLVALLAQKVIITDRANPLNDTFKQWGLHIHDRRVIKQLDQLDESELVQNRAIILNRVNMAANQGFFETLLHL